MQKLFKSVLSVFLTVLLLTSSCVFAFSANKSEDLSFFVASDIHYRPLTSLGELTEQNSLPGDEMYFHANTKGMLSFEADAVIDEFLSRFEQSGCNILLIPGDISEDGFWDEHLAIAEKLREFKERTGKKIFLIPGNHDIRTSESKNRLDLSDFLEIYANIGYDLALSRDANTASYTAELDGNYRLIAIDACIYRQDGSIVTPELLSWIEAQVIEAKNDGKKLVGMVHHSVLEHFEIQSIGGGLLCLDNYRELATKFADWGIKYFFTGHEHANDISSAVSESGNKIFDIETGSLITYPNAYREVTFTDDSAEILTKYIDRINIELLPDGYSDAQLELIKNDFPTYSLNYFRAGFKSYAYQIPGTVGKLAEKLKISEGTSGYDALTEVMNTLRDAVCLPMYDALHTPETDSIEEIAAKAGATLEQSCYTDVLDLAAVVYSGHYAGDEHLDFDSTEVRLLGQSLGAVLLYALMNVPVRTANTLFKSAGLENVGFSVSERTFTSAAKLLYMKSAVKTIMREFVKPIAAGIINDSSEPLDLNVSLEGYGETFGAADSDVDISEPDYIFGIILRILRAVFRAIRALIVPQG